MRQPGVGRTEAATECLLVIKMRAERWEGLEARLRALHPYSGPEVLGWAVPAGHGPHLEWVGERVAAKGGE